MLRPRYWSATHIILYTSLNCYDTVKGCDSLCLCDRWCKNTLLYNFHLIRIMNCSRNSFDTLNIFYITIGTRLYTKYKHCSSSIVLYMRARFKADIFLNASIDILLVHKNKGIINQGQNQFPSHTRKRNVVVTNAWLLIYTVWI